MHAKVQNIKKHFFGRTNHILKNKFHLTLENKCSIQNAKINLSFMKISWIKMKIRVENLTKF